MTGPRSQAMWHPQLASCAIIHTYHVCALGSSVAVGWLDVKRYLIMMWGLSRCSWALVRGG